MAWRREDLGQTFHNRMLSPVLSSLSLHSCSALILQAYIYVRQPIQRRKEISHLPLELSDV